MANLPGTRPPGISIPQHQQVPLQLHIDAFNPLAMFKKHRNTSHRQTKPICESMPRIASHHAPDLVVIYRPIHRAGPCVASLRGYKM